MKKNSFKVSLGGIVTAVCLVLMFMTSFMPLLVYTIPAVAGVLMAVIVIEISKKWAILSYISVGLLSFLITPDKEAAVLFVLFLGYYPILKSVIERIKPFLFEWIVKLVIFNVAIITAYYVIINIFGIVDMLTEFEEFGRWAIPLILLMANVVFVVYDIAITRLITSYISWFRPKFLRKFK